MAAKPASVRKYKLWHPRHALSWFGLGLHWLLGKLPWAWQLRLGRSLGRFCFQWLKLRRAVVETNLSLCFPRLSGEERMNLARQHYEALGIGVFEVSVGWYGSERRVRGLIDEIEGLNHLRELAAEGRGALLLTAHFTTLEMTGRMLNLMAPIGAVFRNPKDPVIAWRMRSLRERKLGQNVIPMQDFMGLVRALKAGEHIWYAPDQGRKTKYSALLPFFGEPAVTNIATARIARMTGCAVVPFFGHRTAEGRYRLRIEPPLAGFPGSDDLAGARRINALIEQAVREAPEQYFWVHKRFKRRGEGLPEVYDRAGTS